MDISDLKLNLISSITLAESPVYEEGEKVKIDQSSFAFYKEHSEAPLEFLVLYSSNVLGFCDGAL